MGHELKIWGMIAGAQYKIDQYRLLQEKNIAIIERWNPIEADEWPWLNRSMFSLPGPAPYGTYRDQIIHFGGSIKDEPGENYVCETLLAKFEKLLGRLFWYRARMILEWESGAPEIYEWTAVQEALDRMLLNIPQPVGNHWVRTLTELSQAK